MVAVCPGYQLKTSLVFEHLNDSLVSTASKNKMTVSQIQCVGMLEVKCGSFLTALHAGCHRLERVTFHLEADKLCVYFPSLFEDKKLMLVFHWDQLKIPNFPFILSCYPTLLTSPSSIPSLHTHTHLLLGFK